MALPGIASWLRNVDSLRTLIEGSAELRKGLNAQSATIRRKETAEFDNMVKLVRLSLE